MSEPQSAATANGHGHDTPPNDVARPDAISQPDPARLPDAERLPDPARSFDAAMAIAGDRAAFVRLVHKTARLVLATILLDVRDPHLADDLTQETFLRAWKAIHTLIDPKGFNAWLISIARAVVIDDARARSRKKRAHSQPAHPLQRVDEDVRDPSATAPHAQLEQQERRQQLIDALRSLPGPQREVLSMRYLADADYATIAEQLNLTDGALRGHLHRGLASLRAKLAVTKT